MLIVLQAVNRVVQAPRPLSLTLRVFTDISSNGHERTPSGHLLNQTCAILHPPTEDGIVVRRTPCDRAVGGP